MGRGCLGVPARLREEKARSHCVGVYAGIAHCCHLGKGLGKKGGRPIASRASGLESLSPCSFGLSLALRLKVETWRQGVKVLVADGL